MLESFNLNDFDYDLPANKIAIYPLENRANCKLLVFNHKISDKKIIHTHFNNITDFIPTDSLLIINSTKVLPARILLNKPTGALIEFLLLEPSNNVDYQIAINSNKTIEWKCIVGGKNIKIKDKFYINCNNINTSYNNINVEIEVLSRNEKEANIRFNWSPEELCFGEILEQIGKIPLPPYIKRNTNENDKNDYQTIYANEQGSVAAPTAGLHFTEDIINKLKINSVKVNEIILHIGMGTFMPIAESIDTHKMHKEKIQVTKETIKNLLTQYSLNKSVIATGTTSLRTLESLYWFAIQLISNNTNFEKYIKNYGFYIEQNEIYNTNYNISLIEAFSRLLEFMDANKLNYIQGSTEIFITPNYNIKTINCLITNFHLPKSTLMLLISAFIGIDNVKNIYKEALQDDYRFLSYGDASLLFR